MPVLYENPIVLGGALLVVLGARSLAGVGRQLRRAMLIAHGLAVLVASEGGARTIALHCRTTCTVRHIADGPRITHAEGHIAFKRR